MEYLSIFGLFAFFIVLSLSNRVSALERCIRENGIGTDYEIQRENLQKNLQERIGAHVKFTFYEDEGDNFLEGLFLSKTGFAEIIDVDEKWVLVHAEDKKKQKDELLRISSIKDVTIVSRQKE